MDKKNTGKYSVSGGEQESGILPNLLGLATKKEIDAAEFQGFFKAQEYCIDALDAETVFDLKYLYAIHKIALGDLYAFAGKLRSVNMSKGGFAFPAARFLPDALKEFEKEKLLRLSKPYTSESELLRDMAEAHAELLFIHPFREGNGRTARLLADLISLKHFGKKINFHYILKEHIQEYIHAVQQAAFQNYEPMERLMGKAL